MKYRYLDLPEGGRLAFRETGSGPVLILLHGFAGTGEEWLPEFSRYLPGRTLVAPDLPGMGESRLPTGSGHWTFPGAVRALAELPQALGLTEADWLGYSMGGRLALALTLERPRVVRSLVLEGVTPGLASATERRKRVRDDARWADLLETEGLEGFADRWVARPIFAGEVKLDDDARTRRLALLRQTDAFALARLLREQGTGTQPWLGDRLSHVTVRVLLLVGEEDEKFRTIAERMADDLPDATVEVVSGAGHAVHREVPDRWAEEVRRFLGAGADQVTGDGRED